MFDELKKSVQSVLYERISSPLSGAFFLSWIVWNWKLIYYITVGDDILNVKERIAFIDANFINIQNNLVYPFASAVVLIVLYPLFSTKAYEAWISYKTWQRNIKNEAEKKRLLTYEQSYNLRLKLKNQEEEFEKIILEKDELNKSLRKRLDEYETEYSQEMGAIDDMEKEAENRIELHKLWKNEFEKFSKLPFFGSFPKLGNIINKGINISQIDDTLSAYAISNDFIIRSDKNPSIYEWTEKGKYFMKLYLNK